MINLENCYCKATKENEAKLKELGYSLDGSYYGIYPYFFIIEEEKIYFTHDYIENEKEVELVNNEFQYVKPKLNNTDTSPLFESIITKIKQDRDKFGTSFSDKVIYNKCLDIIKQEIEKIIGIKE